MRTEANEGIERGSDDARAVFVCECARLGCNQLIALSRAAYEAVRAHSRRLFVLATHELLEIERVVERHDDCLVVEQLGEAGDVAGLTDPRRPSDEQAR
jgi:hypothetical protein